MHFDMIEKRQQDIQLVGYGVATSILNVRYSDLSFAPIKKRCSLLPDFLILVLKQKTYTQYVYIELASPYD